MFSNIINSSTKTRTDMPKLTEKFLLQMYGKNFLSNSSSNDNEIKVLTDDDRYYLKSKIIIYNIILNSQKEFTTNTYNVYLKNNAWLKWYTKLSENIINLKDTTN